MIEKMEVEKLLNEWRQKKAEFANNPNGIPSLSPGLRGTSYPGSAIPISFPTPWGLHPGYFTD
jgi:hypothetical protein